MHYVYMYIWEQCLGRLDVVLCFPTNKQKRIVRYGLGLFLFCLLARKYIIQSNLPSVPYSKVQVGNRRTFIRQLNWKNVHYSIPNVCR